MAQQDWNLTTTDVIDRRLTSVQNVKTDALELALSEATAKVNSAIKRFAYTDPSQITSVLYPDDWTTIQGIVCDGAVAIYIKNVEQQQSKYMTDFEIVLESIKDDPAQFSFYSGQDGGNTILSHTTGMTQSEIDQRTSRMIDLSNPAQNLL